MSETSRELELNATFVKLADTLIADFDVVDLLHVLVQKCTDLLDAQAGGLMLADYNGHLQLMASTSERADVVEVMQLNAGEGPCVECFTTGRALTVGDIDKAAGQWPDFRSAALEQGIRSVHAVPMRLRDEVLGAMNLFSTSVGEMGERDKAVAQALADVATIGILQERNIRESANVTEQLQSALNSRILIEQAKGVLAHSGNMNMDEAFNALRGYARNSGLTLRTVAEDVTNRTLDLATIRSSTATPNA